MSELSSKRSGHSIARPIFMLAIAAIVIATGLTFLITFAGPPPRPAPVALSEIAAALKGTSQVNAEGATLRAIAGLPRQRAGEQPDVTRDARLAALLGGGAVRGFYAQPPRGGDGAIRGDFTVGWQSAGGWRTVTSLPNRLFWRWLGITLLAMAAAMAVMAGAAWIIVRAIARPLRALAATAAAAKLGGPAPVFDSEGPREVLELAQALTDMQTRITDEADGRTAMLAAIAHDLGTPLSRVAFWIEQLPEPQRDRAAADIEEMRGMLGEVLRFAREQRVEAPTKIDLGSVIDSLVDDLMMAGQPVTLIPGPRVLVTGDAAALRRLFANLIENAVRYGDCARVTWQNAADRVAVVVADDGPGFDPALGDRAFAPFVRGDPSRNRATGGSGLGLAIVKAITEAHGGTVELGGSIRGGGVTVMLPTA